MNVILSISEIKVKLQDFDDVDILRIKFGQYIILYGLQESKGEKCKLEKASSSKEEAIEKTSEESDNNEVEEKTSSLEKFQCWSNFIQAKLEAMKNTQKTKVV